MITAYSILLTTIVYKLSRRLGQRYSSPLTSPVFLSTAMVIFLLLVSHINYQEYIPAKKNHDLSARTSNCSISSADL
ncbi:LrgB family protein [Neobacillus drentensis]|uniref:LrgB family protein n=1 Tax=Neobacillus drentensis TaxID=220684 RepID=UPI00286C9CB5|nr:LrgB family protein [Neobacillus drentensis]